MFKIALGVTRAFDLGLAPNRIIKDYMGIIYTKNALKGDKKGETETVRFFQISRHSLGG